MSTLNIPIILGTARNGRQSEKVAQFIFNQMSSMDEIETQIVDPRDFDFGDEVNFDETRDPKYSKLTAAADGFIIVCPEYNHAFPSSLKKMLDSESKNYLHKPAAIVGVSAGNWGGVRAIETLIPVLRTLGFVLLQNDLHFPKVETLFDENGTITNDRYPTRVARLMDELVWMTRALKHSREMDAKK